MRTGCTAGWCWVEMKPSEHLSFTGTCEVQGFVDLGSFTPEDARRTPADHGLVIMFQPFVGAWTQIIGVFASRGNVKAHLLTKILVEASILCEQAGLFVDLLCCDGASWNRFMLHMLGIRATNSKDVNCKIPHPVDSWRSLYFLSDFPHLAKCVRHSFQKAGFDTHKGRVLWEHTKAA
ncbi:uncharacterized protein LOC135398409 [Ornithodoros turicata]|uniref:uncharacterized protein LOC135398409 n=1 Tax=Ornithodoros turicata TaxID=34597 RepID=UPI003139EEA1